MDCEFCKIIKGELPSSKLYENDTTISFMDIADDVLHCVVSDWIQRIFSY